jgi:RNA recognition motif-containing protein
VYVSAICSPGNKKLEYRSNNIRISVNNLSFDITEEELRREFEVYGDVTSVIIVKNKFDGLSRGSAFIEMLKAMEGYEAIDGLNGKILKERAVVVKAARNWNEFGNNLPSNRSRYNNNKKI